MNYLGIRGFESVLRGGIPARAEVLLLTPEGPERFLLGAHWVLEGLSRGERVLAVLSGESPDAFVARLGRMGVDAASAIASGSLTIVDWYTCWTQPVEGMEEVHRMFRASRKVEDLFAAVDRAIPVLAPATDRRAFVDVLPLALKALDEAGATEALKALRSRLSEAGVTAVFAADRALPEARRDVLFPTFHAVLDARGEERDVLSFAVLAVGGVKLAGRYRRARVREDGASVETAPTVRTFSCPICDARVPFDAAKCPSCGTLRAEMSVGTREAGLMDYVETLGREGGVPSARPRPARESRAPGLTNGVRAPRPGRVNGVAPGRVNGTAPKGRTNGLAPAGRTNGLQTGPGQTNGLVNGLARARSGMTNGLTNGSGFTNGLGGRRHRGEARVSRWKLFLVPMLGAALLLSPFLFTEAPAAPRFAVDGDFADWTGVAGYAQDPDPDANATVAITGYRVAIHEGSLYLYVTVAGSWFADRTDVHGLYVFIDGDSAPTTGYRVRSLGAERLGVVEGANGAVTVASIRTYGGDGDPYNWTAWQSAGSGSAVSAGGELEASFPWDGEAATQPSILLLVEDGRGSRSYSAVAFGPDLGALRVSVRSRASVVSRGTPDVLAVEMESVGGPVTVRNFTWDVSDGVGVVAPPLPATLNPGQPEQITVRFDTRNSDPGDLLIARLAAVTTEPRRPVLIVEDRVRAYVESAPDGKAVDGWFMDWDPVDEISSDVDVGQREADLDLQGYAANRTGDTLFLYADVRGQILAGTPAPVRRLLPAPGESAPSAPGIPGRTVGEDILRVYVDADANATGGIPLLGLRGADYLLEIRGIHGEITQRSAFEWRDGWRTLASPPAENDAKRLEVSLDLAGAGAIQVSFATSGWRGPADSTEVSGTRGVRGLGGDYWHDGLFTATFRAGGRVEVAAEGVGLAWTLPAPETGAWSLEATPVGVRYAADGAEVRYTLDFTQLKEEFVLSSPPERGELRFGFALSGGAMAWLDDGGSIGILSGDVRVFTLPPPFAVDARGRTTPLEFDLDLAAGTLRIPLPGTLLDPANYPVTVDPPVTYALRNDGAANDTGENLGWSVAVGDFNGDGYADVLTGAPSNDRPPGPGQHGYAYVYYGPFSGDDGTPNVWINATPYTNSTRFGYAVAAGKFNGDQYWDALVARRSLLGSAVGNVSIYYGASGWSGEESSPDVNFLPPDAPKNFGEVVAVGNLDNANSDDVLIAEPGRDLDGNGIADGVVYAYMSPFGAAETSSDYRLRPSTNGGGQLGLSVAVAKVDSDAYADVVVGEPKYQDGGGDGRLQFYKGSHFTSGSGDVTPDATIGAPSGGGSTGNFGASVAVGPLDEDAYADVLVGAPFKFSNDGRAYIFPANGDGSGLTSGASPSITLSSQTSAERFGTAVLIADWGDDGTADAVVGAAQAAAGGTNRGSVYWFDDPLANQGADETLSGAQNNEFYGRVLAAGKFSNDSRTVLAIGAYLWDKNAANPNDNDGRVVVAMVPEPSVLMAASVLLLPVASSLRHAFRRPRSLGRRGSPGERASCRRPARGSG